MSNPVSALFLDVFWRTRRAVNRMVVIMVELHTRRLSDQSKSLRSSGNTPCTLPWNKSILNRRRDHPLSGTAQYQFLFNTDPYSGSWAVHHQRERHVSKWNPIMARSCKGGIDRNNQDLKPSKIIVLNQRHFSFSLFIKYVFLLSSTKTKDHDSN